MSKVLVNETLKSSRFCNYDEIILRNCIITGPIAIINSKNILISRCKFINLQENNSNFLNINGINFSLTVIDNTIDCQKTSNFLNLKNSKCQNILIARNILTNFVSTAISIKNCITPDFSPMIIKENFCECGETGIKLTQCHNTIITENTLSCLKDNAIIVDSCLNTNIEKNFIHTNIGNDSSCAILLLNDSTKVDITKNKIWWRQRKDKRINHSHKFQKSTRQVTVLGNEYNHFFIDSKLINDSDTLEQFIIDTFNLLDFDRKINLLKRLSTSCSSPFAIIRL
jgi:hypothetical protein